MNKKININKRKYFTDRIKDDK